MNEKLEFYPARELWAPANSQIENGTEQGEPFLRWTLEAGKSATLAMQPTNPLFGRLRYYNRLEFEFRIVSGQLDFLELRALGHVSGARRFKVHQWQLAILTTPSGVWHTRQVDLERPNWFPWDDPDGNDPHFLFGALAVAPNTVIEFRRMRLLATPLVIKPFFETPITWPIRSDESDGAVTFTLQVSVLNVTGRPAVIESGLVSEHSRFAVSVEPASREVKNGEKAEFTVKAQMTRTDREKTPELYSEPLRLAFWPKGDREAAATFEMPLVRPLSPGLKRQFLVSEADLKFLRQRLEQGDEGVKKAIKFDEILASADRFLGFRLEQLPAGHGHPLNRWPVVPDSQPPKRYELGDFMPEIVNPVTGEREAGTELAGRVWKEYLALAGKATENLGLAYLLTGDEKYARKAVELMRLYAKHYGDLPWSTPWEPPWSSGPAILAASRVAMNSSYGTNMLFRWHMRMLGMIGDSKSFTPEAREEIYRGFVLPYATELMKFPGGISNMTDITNHNLLVLGLVFNDALLVRWALQSDPGLLSRLSDIDVDGFSSEGRSLNYHAAGMEEYLPSLAYLDNSGLPVAYSKERLLEIVRMPYRRATLWGAVPNVGDCGRGMVVGNSGLADHLLALFPEETWLLDVGKGDSLAAKVKRLATGLPIQKDGYKKYLETKPRLFRDAGLAILRTGETPENQIMATLDYGRNTMHGHRDRNQITLAAFGKIFTHGPGTIYNAGSGGVVRASDPKLDSFCSSGSLGQNVILVDAQNQTPAVGELLAWNGEPTNQYTVARVDGIAPGVSHTRSLILRDGLVIILDRVESDAEHLYDFVYHNFGTLSLGPGWSATPVAKPLAETANYQNIIDLGRLSGEGPVRLNWDLADQVPDPAKVPSPLPPIKLALWQLPVPGSELYIGITGLNNPNTKRVPDVAPSLMTRVKGKTAAFVTVLEPYKGQPTVTAIEGNAEKLIIHRGAERMEIRQADLLKSQSE